MAPPPIETLQSLLPNFRLWHAELSRKDVPATGERGLSVMAASVHRISPLDDSAEASLLRTALDQWMESHRFVDDWIRDVATCTLFAHAGGADPRIWHMSYDFTTMGLPEPPLPPQHKPFEPYDVYQRRLEQYHRKSLGEFKRRVAGDVRERLGTRKDQRRPAEWAAMRFAGRTSARIAMSLPRLEDRNLKTVEKSLTRFAQRVGGLTFP
jgi:hypothetical protein